MSGNTLSKKQRRDRLHNRLPGLPLELPHEVPAILESLRITALQHGTEDVGHQRFGLKKPVKSNLIMLDFYNLRSTPGYRGDNAQLKQVGSTPGVVGSEPRVVGSGRTTSHDPVYQGGGSLF